MSVRVLDPFGSPVPRTTDDSGGLTVTTSGQLLLSGFESTASLLNDDGGFATVTLIADRSEGEASAVITPPSSTLTPACRKGFMAPIGIEPPTPSIEIDFHIGEPPVPDKPSIAITDEFTWRRVTGKTARVYVATPDASVRSNRVTIS